MSKEHKDRVLKALERFGEKVNKNREEYEREAWKKSKAKDSKGKKSKIPSEHSEQVRLARYLDSLGVLWCAVPNSGHGAHGRQGAIRGARMRAEGLKAGVPDILVFDKPPGEGEARPTCSGVAIELKRVKGGRVSEEQRRWLKDLSARGWVTRVCNGFDEAATFLQELGYADKKEKE